MAHQFRSRRVGGNTKDLKSIEHNRLLITIAQKAARIIAEEGENDYARACKKAARSLGLQGHIELPGHEQIEAAVRDFQSLFQSDSQPQVLHDLRQAALQNMYGFERFSPRLTGAVADGTASRYSPIEIEIDVDDIKEFDFYLMDRKIPFRIGTTNHNASRLLYHLESNTPEVQIIVCLPDSMSKQHINIHKNVHKITLDIKQLTEILAV